MDESLKKLVIDISEGNPGCITVLMNVYKTVGAARFEAIARTLRHNGVTGSHVWCEYKDMHGQDIEAFITSVEENLIEPITDRRGLIAEMKRKSVDQA